MWHQSQSLMLLSLIAISYPITTISKADSKIITYESKSPYEFSELINQLDNSIKTKVSGELTMPVQYTKNKQFPLVIVLPDAFGFENHHQNYLNNLNQQGIATFKVDSFKSRHINPKKMVATTVSPEMMASDAYFALKTLSKHPNIDPNKIAVMGWGSGGAAALYSAWTPAKEAFLTKKAKGFAAHLAIYPPCLLFPTKHTWQKKPIKIIIGEKDQSTPASLCKELSQQMKKSGVPIEIDILPNAYHSFDSERPLQTYKKEHTFTQCRFTLLPDGVALHEKTGIRMIDPFFRLAAFYACSEKKTVRSGMIPEAKKRSIEMTNKFFNQHLTTLPECPRF